MGYSPWGSKELATTEWLSTSFMIWELDITKSLTFLVKNIVGSSFNIFFFGWLAIIIVFSFHIFPS